MRSNSHQGGFTLIELMVVVAVVGILVTLAVSAFLSYVYRARSAEAALNLRAIYILEKTHAVARDTFLAAADSPDSKPTTGRRAWYDQGGFSDLGWAPEGEVYFTYTISVNAPGSSFVAVALGDLDGNEDFQLWGVAAALPGAPDLAPCPHGGTITKTDIVHELSSGAF